MKNILIVDDSQFMRNVLKELLMDNSSAMKLSQAVTISEADSRINAKRKFKELKPDVILLDMVMQSSETEGIEFIEEIRDSFDPKKIIMISSIGQPHLLDECKRLGIVTYLQKPFEQNEVIDAVNNAMK